ncbi:EAL domain-containing protein [Micromonospora sp. WMMD812]|uniref:putative bifunctional diguanylate cyclase/phosphodiesterase n=1 Tax=Micromonospora sp. WMMD812 TaxID=3015152 RepID=UPI00248B15EE|nr:EAL domain-containing protein [Micromonospora sp. WMMD812]WBB68321.1 EAL domain-containing protein [Micromonospora sp. WMMD812]
MPERELTGRPTARLRLVRSGGSSMMDSVTVAAAARPPDVVGPLARPVAVVDADVRCAELDLRFRADPALACVAVRYLDGGVGLIGRDRFAQLMSGPFGYGRALWEKTPVGHTADPEPMIVDELAPVVDVCEQLGRRGRVRRYDDVLVRQSGGQLARVSAARLYEALADLMAYQAVRDPLSGLANRARFRNRLGAACRATDSAGVAVVFIDLDRMKEVNDTLGHNLGDRLIVSAAHRLAAAAYDHEVVARLGGDEFAVLTRIAGGFPPNLSAVALGERFRQAIARPDPALPPGAHSVASVGVAVGAAGVDPDTLLREADLAMYRAKQAGGDKVRIALHVDAQLAPRPAAGDGILAAVERGELRLFYQPIIGVNDGRVWSVEALVRWQHPQHGLLTPDRFLADVRRARQLPTLDRWVLDRACADLATWDAILGHRAPRYVNVNLTADTLGAVDLAGQVLGALGRVGLARDRLRLELPESADLAQLQEAVQQLRELRDHGVGIVLDDMGAGSATLRHLSVLPVTGIKIDRSFVAGMLESRNDHAVVKLLGDLGRSVGIDVTAEGIEVGEQLDWLRHLQVPYAQGYLLGMPAPAEHLTALLSTGRPQGVARMPLDRPERHAEAGSHRG